MLLRAQPGSACVVVNDPGFSSDSSLLQKLDFPAMKFSLYFLAYEDKNDIPKDKSEKTAWTFSRKATLELTHNWGTEDDETQSYHNGNSDPRGFGTSASLYLMIVCACACACVCVCV